MGLTATVYVHPEDSSTDVEAYVADLPWEAKMAAGEVRGDQRVPRGRPIVVIQGEAA